MDDPVYKMQMAISFDFKTSYFLFKTWHGYQTGGMIVLFLLTMAVVASSYVVMYYHGKFQSAQNKNLALLMGFLMRALDYLQMLILMSTFNFWFLIVLALSHGVFSYVSGLIADNQALESLKN